MWFFSLDKVLRDKIDNMPDDCALMKQSIQELKSLLIEKEDKKLKVFFWTLLVLPLITWIVLIFLYSNSSSNEFLLFLRDYGNTVVIGYTIAIISSLLLSYFNNNNKVNKDLLWLAGYFYIYLAFALTVSYFANDLLSGSQKLEDNQRNREIHSELIEIKNLLKKSTNSSGATMTK